MSTAQAHASAEDNELTVMRAQTLVGVMDLAEANAKLVAEQQGEIAELRDNLSAMKARKDGAYEERNRVVAALARACIALGMRVGITKTNIPGWDEEWHTCAYIDLPTGQCAWHVHDSQVHLFERLPEYTGTYDGHTTPEKYERVAKFAEQ